VRSKMTTRLIVRLKRPSAQCMQVEWLILQHNATACKIEVTASEILDISCITSHAIM